MSPMRPEKCPYCGGAKLTFAEQLSSVTVYQCEDCGRAVSVTRRSAEAATKRSA